MQDDFLVINRLERKSKATLKKELSHSVRVAIKADKNNNREVGEKHWAKAGELFNELNRRD